MPSGTQRPFASFARYRGRKRPVKLQPMTAVAGAGTNYPPRRRYLITQSVYQEKLLLFENSGKENYLQPKETGCAPSSAMHVKTKIPDKHLTPPNGCEEGRLTNFSRISPNNIEGLNGDKGRSRLTLQEDPSMHSRQAQLMSKHPAQPPLANSPRRRRPCWDCNSNLPDCDHVALSLDQCPGARHVQIPPEPVSLPHFRDLKASQSSVASTQELHKNQILADSVKAPAVKDRQIRHESDWEVGRDIRNHVESDGHEEGSQRNRQIHIQPSQDVVQMTGIGEASSEIWRQKGQGNEQNETLQLIQFQDRSQIAAKARTQSGDFRGTKATEASFLSMPAFQMRGQQRQPNDQTPQSPIRHHSKLTYFDDIRILNAWNSLAERPNSCSYAALALDVTNTANSTGTGPALRVAVVEHRMRMLREAFDDIIYLSLQGCIKPGSEGDHFTFFKELQMIVLKSREARKARKEISIAQKGGEMANPRGRRKLFLGGVPIGEISRRPQDIALLKNVRARFKFGSSDERLKQATSKNPCTGGTGHTPLPEGVLSRKEVVSATGSKSAPEQTFLVQKVSNGNCSLTGTKDLHVGREGSLQKESIGHTLQEKRKVGNLKSGKKAGETKKLSAPGAVGTNSRDSEHGSAKHGCATHNETLEQMGIAPETEAALNGNESERDHAVNDHVPDRVGSSANSHLPSCDSTVEIGVTKLSKHAKDIGPRRVVCGSVLVLRARKQHTTGAGPDTLSEKSLTIERTEHVQRPTPGTADMSAVPFPTVRSDAVRSNPTATVNGGDRRPQKRRRSSKRVEDKSTAIHQEKGTFETNPVCCPRESRRKLSSSCDGKMSIPHPAVESEDAVQLSDEGDIEREFVEMEVVERERSGHPVRTNGTKGGRLRRKHSVTRNDYKRERIWGKGPAHGEKTCARITSKIARHREKRQQVITEMRVMAVALEQVGLLDLAWKYKTRLSTLRETG